MRTLLKVEEVAVLVGVSKQTIDNWYRFKKENPDNKYAQMLPDFVRIGGHGQKFWDKADIDYLIKYKSITPKGCKGVMGSVTQRYVKKEG